MEQRHPSPRARIAGRASDSPRPKKFRLRRPVLEWLEGRDMPATLTVNSLSDAVNPGAGEVTLRQAVVASQTGGTTALGQTGYQHLVMGRPAVAVAVAA